MNIDKQNKKKSSIAFFVKFAYNLALYCKFSISGIEKRCAVFGPSVALASDVCIGCRRRIVIFD